MLLCPALQPDANKYRAAYELTRDLLVVHELGSVLVPAGFQYDGASIPRPVWSIIGSPFEPQFMRAALAHDWLYHVHHRHSRRRADELFRALLIEDGVGETLANVMFQAVRLGGRCYWGNDVADLAYLQRLRERIAREHRNPADYGL